MFRITELTPADGDEVRHAGNVEISVHTVHKFTVVYPTVLGSTDTRNKVVTTHINRPWTNKHDIADDDVLAALQAQDA